MTGMLRENYEEVLAASPRKSWKLGILGWQTWYTTLNYALPFGKVRKGGTLYLRPNPTGWRKMASMWIFFPRRRVPDAEQRQETAGRLLKIYRTKLMKSHHQPWRENEKTSGKSGLANYTIRRWRCFLTVESRKGVRTRWRRHCRKTAMSASRAP